MNIRGDRLPSLLTQEGAPWRLPVAVLLVAVVVVVPVVAVVVGLSCIYHTFMSMPLVTPESLATHQYIIHMCPHVCLPRSAGHCREWSSLQHPPRPAPTHAHLPVHLFYMHAPPPHLHARSPPYVHAHPPTCTPPPPYMHAPPLTPPLLLPPCTSRQGPPHRQAHPQPGGRAGPQGAGRPDTHGPFCGGHAVGLALRAGR